MRILVGLLVIGCATAPVLPPVVQHVMIPHVCLPVRNSIFYQKCAADCPDGQAFIFESASDVSCHCRKPPEIP